MKKNYLNCWGVNASDYDHKLFDAISKLYSDNEFLIHFLFNPDRPILAKSSEDLIYDSGVFSNSEQLLVRIGLDIWNGSGGIHFNELYEDLDSQNFQKVLLVLLLLKHPNNAVLF
jgi:hypothetical protein